MPLEYAGGGVLAEHAAVRTAVGVFDVSHLGKATVAGPGAAAYVNRCLTNDLGKIGPGQAQYTLLCTDDGGVVDDLIAYLRSPDDVLLIPNAANTAAVVGASPPEAPDGRHRHRPARRLHRARGPGHPRRRGPEHRRSAGGPRLHVLRRGGPAGVPVTVCRTGYTGERGYELVAPAAGGVRRSGTPSSPPGSRTGCSRPGWARGTRCGPRWAIRCTARTSPPTITPVQARLGWAVGWRKETFAGAEALRAEKEAGPRVLRGLKAGGRGIPRPGWCCATTRDRSSGRHVGHVLADAEDRHRARPGRRRVR